MKISNHRLPRDREVAQFVCLHLNTVKVRERHPQKKDHWLYSVEGKPRPMIVLRRLPHTERGRTRFVVLPVTKSGLDERGRVKDGYAAIGNCIDSSFNSFVKVEQQILPDNMLDSSIGDGGIIGVCDPLGFSNAIKMLQRKLLQHGLVAEHD